MVPRPIAAVEIAAAPEKVVAAEEAGQPLLITGPSLLAVATVAAGAALEEKLTYMSGGAVAGPNTEQAALRIAGAAVAAATTIKR